eukprot:m.71590 g.71590  ORF g.71590 m.71590 type:complete len:80 (-) comp11709_c0_seq1:555-794(-)
MDTGPTGLLSITLYWTWVGEAEGVKAVGEATPAEVEEMIGVGAEDVNGTERKLDGTFAATFSFWIVSIGDSRKGSKVGR